MKRAGLLLVLLALPALGTPFSWPSPYRLQDSFDSPAHPGRLARYLTPSGSTVSTSGVTFTRSSAGAACTAADGTVTFPASGVPCLAGGYHARPSIANLLVQTDAFDNAAWIASATSPTTLTVTNNYAVAPDGTQTADRIHATTDSTHTLAYSLRQVVTLTAGSAYSYSFYVLNNSASTTDANYRVFCNTTASDIVAPTSYLSSLSTSAWVRISVGFTVPAGCTGASNVYVYAGSNGAATNGVTDVSAWGAQVVPGSLPLDYCPSGSTPATCAAEVMTVPTPSGMSLTSGCAKVCVTPSWTGANPLATSTFLLSANAAGTSRPGYVAASADTFGAFDGAHVVSVAAGFTAGARSCFLTQWSATAGSLQVTNLTTATAGTASAFTALPSFASTIDIGSLGGGAQPLGAVIDSIVLGSSPEACN